MDETSQNVDEANLSEVESLKRLGTPFVSSDELPQKLGSCIVDGSTLIQSHTRLGWYASSGGRRLNRNQVPENEALLQFLQAIVIYDRIYIDGGLVVIDEAIKELVRQLAGVVIPIYVSPKERGDLVSYLGKMDLERISHAADAFGASVLRADVGEWLSFQRSFRGADERKVVTLPPFLANSSQAPIRIAYYLALSLHLGLPYAPHPLRAPALAAVHDGMSLQGNAQNVVDRFEREVIGPILKNGFQHGICSVHIPPIGERVLHESLQNGRILETALSIRDSKRAKRFREWCRELEEALATSMPGIEVIQKKDNEAKRLFADWSKDVDEGVRYKTRTLSFALSAGVGLTASIKFDPFTFKDPILISKRSGLLFLNDLLRSTKAHGLLQKLGRRDTADLKRLEGGAAMAVLRSMLSEGFFNEPREFSKIVAEVTEISRVDAVRVPEALEGLAREGLLFLTQTGWIQTRGLSLT